MGEKQKTSEVLSRQNYTRTTSFQRGCGICKIVVSIRNPFMMQRVQETWINHIKIAMYGIEGEQVAMLIRTYEWMHQIK